jgi:hypothetical protein
MIDLAISIGENSKNTTVIETNHGLELKATDWPHDCDFQIVAFDPVGENCEVVWARTLAEDIGRALTALDDSATLKGRNPDWYRRLERCARGALSA